MSQPTTPEVSYLHVRCGALKGWSLKHLREMSREELLEIGDPEISSRHGPLEEALPYITDDFPSCRCLGCGEFENYTLNKWFSLFPRRKWISLKEEGRIDPEGDDDYEEWSEEIDGEFPRGGLCNKCVEKGSYRKLCYFCCHPILANGMCPEMARGIGRTNDRNAFYAWLKLQKTAGQAENEKYGKEEEKEKEAVKEEKKRREAEGEDDDNERPLKKRVVE